MLEYLAVQGLFFVTNAVSHAQTLAKMGNPGLPDRSEKLKSSTEAVVGSQAMQMIQMYHFTKGLLRNQRDHQKRRLYHTGYQ